MVVNSIPWPCFSFSGNSGQLFGYLYYVVINYWWTVNQPCEMWYTQPSSNQLNENLDREKKSLLENLVMSIQLFACVRKLHKVQIYGANKAQTIVEMQMVCSLQQKAYRCEYFCTNPKNGSAQESGNTQFLDVHYFRMVIYCMDPTNFTIFAQFKEKITF